MNDILELWSLPWHVLQRSLAKSFSAQTAVSAPVNSKCSNERPAGAPASWLVRALSIAGQPNP
jgi:hypothetical protein